MQDNAAILRDVLERCARYNVEAAVVSLDCGGGRPEIALGALRPYFREAGVGLRVSLGFSPPSDERELSSWPERLQVAIATVRELAREEEVVAIGEVGLDYHWPVVSLLEAFGIHANPGRDAAGVVARHPAMTSGFGAYRDAQQAVFRSWIELACELDLPLVVHEREAFEDALALLTASHIHPDRVMYHCFSGTPEQAATVAGRGFWISVPSSVGYREPYRSIAKTVPLGQLMTETDSPYHSPVIGMWKEARRRVLAAPDHPREESRAFQALQREAFADALQSQFPGMDFASGPDLANTRVFAAEHFGQSKTLRRQNEPTFVRCAAREIAKIKGKPIEETCMKLTENALELFGRF